MEKEKILLPWNMNPNIEKWEKLGFVFEPSDVHGMALTTLPNNWRSEKDESVYKDCYNIKIYDENDNLRAKVVFSKTNSFFEKDDLNMEMLPKYYYLIKPCFDGLFTSELVFGNEKETLFVAGYQNELLRLLEYSTDKSQKKRKKEAKQYMNALLDDAIAFSDKAYINHNNPLAYWGNEKVDTINCYLLNTRKLRSDYDNRELGRQVINIATNANKVFFRKLNNNEYCDELNFHIYKKTAENENIFYDKTTGMYFDINDLEDTKKDIYDVINNGKPFSIDLYLRRKESQECVKQIEEIHDEDERQRGITNLLLLTKK